MIKIISIDNQSINTNCLGCSLAKKEIIPYGGIILESEYFLVTQDIEIPIPAFLIISSKRHISSILDFSKEERNEFNKLLIITRQAIKQFLPDISVTIIQKEDRPHFHLWFFPRFSWMDKYGKKLNGISEILEYSRNNLKTKENLEKITHLNSEIKNFINLNFDKKEVK